MSSILKTGKLPKDKIPDLKIDQYYLVDRHGNWSLYEDPYGDLDSRIKDFIKNKQRRDHTFTVYSIIEYKAYNNSNDYEN